MWPGRRSIPVLWPPPGRHAVSRRSPARHPRLQIESDFGYEPKTRDTSSLKQLKKAARKACAVHADMSTCHLAMYKRQRLLAAAPMAPMAGRWRPSTRLGPRACTPSSCHAPTAGTQGSGSRGVRSPRKRTGGGIVVAPCWPVGPSTPRRSDRSPRGQV